MWCLNFVFTETIRDICSFHAISHSNFSVSNEFRFEVYKCIDIEVFLGYTFLFCFSSLYSQCFNGVSWHKMIICERNSTHTHTKTNATCIQHYRVYSVHRHDTRNVYIKYFWCRETMQIYEGKMPHFIVYRKRERVPMRTTTTATYKTHEISYSAINTLNSVHSSIN